MKLGDNLPAVPAEWALLDAVLIHKRKESGQCHRLPRCILSFSSAGIRVSSPTPPTKAPAKTQAKLGASSFFGSHWIDFEKRKTVQTWRLRGHRATLKGQFLPVSTKIHQISNSRMSRSRLDEISLFLRVKLWVSFTLQPKSTILKSSIAALHHFRLHKVEYCHQARDGSGTAKAGVEQSTFWNIY